VDFKGTLIWDFKMAIDLSLYKIFDKILNSLVVSHERVIRLSSRQDRKFIYEDISGIDVLM
jgi:hypothetical protein